MTHWALAHLGSTPDYNITRHVSPPLRTLPMRKLFAALVVVLGAVAVAPAQDSPKRGITKKPYGKLPDGSEVEEYSLTNRNGVTMKVITLGGIVTELHVPDKDGKMADVCLGCSNLEEYLE